MPNSNNNHNTATASPVKRPGLGRRAISSHAVITRANSSGSGDLSDPSSSTTHSQKPHHVSRHHHHPRPHLVGHRHHHVRNPSLGKNANKLQRLASGMPETGKNHHRKKSAPTTPAASPPRGAGGGGGHHVHWGGETEEPEAHLKESVKKNNSSPALRRTHFTSGGSKKTLASERPLSSSGKKKTVGFELGDSENDDGEWEDTTQSPESTRRSSVVQSRDSADNAAALVDPLIFVKRPVPHVPRASSLPEPRSSKKFAQEGHLKDEDTDEEEGTKQETQQTQEKDQEQPSQPEQQQEQKQEQEKEQEEKRPREQQEQESESAHAPESSAIASRLLSPSLSAKAPPAMSSISALAEPTATDVHIPPNTSLNNLASGQDGSRRTVSSSTQLANTPGNQTQATSSSIEGGVSRFIVDNNRAANQPSYKTDSDPNTPSSFLPHYHPNTPPSPKAAPSSQKPKASPPTRPPGSEPPSRTQQKLWLQRTAALNTSPPDSHASGNGSPSTMDPAYMATARPGSSPYDSRGLANGAVRAGVSGHDSEAKQTRKAYEKTALELDVVRRFQSPTADSFNRLRSVIHETQAHERRASLTKPVQSAPTLPLLRDGQQPTGMGQPDPAPEPRQLIGRRMPETSSTQSVSQAYTQDADDSSVTASDGDHGNAQKSPHPSQRILSSSDDTAQGNSSAEDDKTEYENEAEMMIRRMWESRVVASSA